MNGPDYAFKHAPDPFDGIGMNVSPGKFSNRMIHGVMDITMIQRVVCA
jgi:hypothetical protein